MPVSRPWDGIRVDKLDVSLTVVLEKVSMQ